MFDPFFIWLEATAFSTWMRESPSVFAFPIILSMHTIGMGLVAGINGALDLTILGWVPGLSATDIKRFFPAMWFGFWLNAASGVALLIGYPTKALTNPVFYIKLAFIVIAIAILKMITRWLEVDTVPETPRPPVSINALAVASLVSWVIVITAGRLLAYTYTRLMAVF
jgi:hypothetical protein